MAKSNTTPKIDRVYEILKDGVEVETKRLAKMIRAKSAAPFVAQLRKQGARIYLNKRTVAGKTVTGYRFDTIRSFTS
jgi:hypothetical protein